MPPTAAEPLAEDSAADGLPPRVLIVAVLRVVGITAAILGAYALLPLDRLSDNGGIVGLCVALAAFVVLMIAQLRAISRSDRPGVRAIEALASLIPTLMVIFSAAYYVMGVASPDSFSESISKLDSLYFTVTVFATVGFGDITAKTELARILVSIQMMFDLVVFGLVAKLIFGAVEIGLKKRTGDSPATPEPGPSAP